MDKESSTSDSSDESCDWSEEESSSCDEGEFVPPAWATSEFFQTHLERQSHSSLDTFFKVRFQMYESKMYSSPQNYTLG